MEFIIDNMIIEWKLFNEQRRMMRILKVNIPEGYLWAYNLLEENCNPEKLFYEDVKDDLANGNAKFLSHDHLAAKYLRSDDQLTDKELSERNIRYELLKPLINAGGGEDILDPETLKILLEPFSKYDREKILRWLRNWWRLGQVINALAPNYQLRGGKGVQRIPNETLDMEFVVNEAVGNKPRFYPKERDHKLMEIYYNRLYISGECDLNGSYGELLQNEYISGYEEDDDGRLKPIELPKGQKPSFYQYRYHCQKMSSREKVISGREGRTTYETKHAPKKKSSRSMAVGPGHFLITDSSLLSFLLVSMLNRSWAIGKPTLYFVIDAFSSLIVGYYLDLSPRSWLSQAMAIVHTATDKVSWCKNFGYTIQPHEWPVAFLGDFYLGDRGEMESLNAGNFLNFLESGVVLTPPRRPGLKSLVEIPFHLINILCFAIFPGSIPTDAVRKKVLALIKKGQVPVVNYNEINLAICKWIVFFNNNHVLSEYVPVHAGMIEDKVDFTPMAIFNWGMENLGGSLRYVPKEQVYRALLPRSTATITSQGIRFKDMYYEPAYDMDQSFETEILLRANEQRFEIVVSFDPRTTDYIFWHHEKEGPKSCLLLEKYKVFQNLTWVDVANYSEYRKDMIERLDKAYNEERRIFESQMKSIAKNAKLEADAVRAELGIKKSNILDGMMRNKIIEQVRIDHLSSLDMMDAQLRFEQEQQLISTGATSPPLFERPVLQPDHSPAVFSALINAFKDEDSVNMEDNNEV